MNFKGEVDPACMVHRGLTPQELGEIAVHGDIVTLYFKNQRMISHRECARLLGKAPHHVARDISDLKSAMESTGLETDFNTGFFFIHVDKELTKDLDKNQKPKRGRPRSPEWLMNYKGFFWLASKYNTSAALKWKSKVLNALEAGHYLATEKLPAMETEMAQLRAENASLKAAPPKQLAGPRKGYIRTPHFQINLWGEKDAIYYEMRPKDELDEQMKALAYLDLYDNMQRGLDEKRSIQINIVTRETLKDRAEVQALAQRRFALPASTNKKKKGKTNE